MSAIPVLARPTLRTASAVERLSRLVARTSELLAAGLGVVAALAVTAVPATFALTFLVAGIGGSISFWGAFPVGLLVAVLPFAVGAALDGGPE